MTEWIPGTKESRDIKMNPKQVRSLRKELEAHSFKPVEDQDPKVPGEWYQDNKGHNILI